MEKYKHEQYIEQRKGKRGWSFRVKYKDCTKTFNEYDYGDPAIAFRLAKKYRDSLRSDLLFGEYKENHITVFEVFNEIYDYFPVRVETKRKLDSLYNRYINIDKEIKSVRQEDIIKCLNKMVGNASDDVIERTLSLWKKIIKTAIIKDYIIKDITIGIKCPKSQFLSPIRHNVLTSKENIGVVANLCKSHLKEQQDRKEFPLLLWFAYYTGCRPCEIFALNKSDIYNNYIDINKELGSDEHNNYVIRPCKTKLSFRKIPIVDEFKPYIEEALSINDNEQLFINPNGLYYNSSYVSDRIHKLCKRQNVEFLNMYQIRHLFSSDLDFNNVDPRTHQELMGHKNYTMSVNYARSNEERKQKALNEREKFPNCSQIS